MIRAIFSCCSLLAFSGFHCTAAETDAIPKKLHVFAGNFWVGPYQVELDGDTLLYWHAGPKDGTSAERIKPSLTSWREFRRELDAIGIWRWQSDYSTHDIDDATEWIFEIQYSDRSIKTGGDSGVFPNKSGAPVSRVMAGDLYTRYVKAMQKLLDCDTFPE
jgi:hypothetical protein